MRNTVAVWFSRKKKRNKFYITLMHPNNALQETTHSKDLPDRGVIRFTSTPSWSGDFREVGVPKFSIRLAPSDKLPLSEPKDPFNSMLTFLLIPCT